MDVTTEPPERDNPVFVTQEDLDRLTKELDTGERLETLSPVKLGEEAGADLARKRFYAFRQLVHPDMRRNWWMREVSDHLEQFYYDMLDGERPRLALMAPPQHGTVGLRIHTAAVEVLAIKQIAEPRKVVALLPFSLAIAMFRLFRINWHVTVHRLSHSPMGCGKGSMS